LNIPEDLRNEICRNFWKLGDYRRQKDFILMNVKSTTVKRRRPTLKEPTNKSKNRSNSKSFFLLNKRVCQSFFLKTLAISNGPLRKAFEHKNEYTNFFDGDDNRGRHPPVNKLSEEIVASVVCHLDQYTSSIAGPKSKRRVITDPDVRSLNHLYRLYRENRNLSPSYTSFKRIFHDHSFSFPPDHVPGRLKQQKLELKEEKLDECDAEYIIEEPGYEEPKVIVVPENMNFSQQVFEIQVIELPYTEQL
jgi:hypothetical protein